MSVMDEVVSSTADRPRIESSFLIESEPARSQTAFHVLLEKGQDGWLVASCRELRGAISQGKSKDEAIRNITEAISLMLEDMHEGRHQEFFVIVESLIA